MLVLRLLCILNCGCPSAAAEQMLAEAGLLAEAIGLEIGHAEIISLSTVRAGSFFGKGVTTRLANMPETVMTR